MSCSNEHSISATQSLAKKTIRSPSDGIKKLMKAVRKLFHHKAQSRRLAVAAASPAPLPVAPLAATLNAAHYYCMSEEEHQNWLNEQLLAAMELLP